MMTGRWLLLLGSNLAGDARVRAALQQLAEIGGITVLTPILRFPSDDDSAGDYFNVLAEFAFEGDRLLLMNRLKRLEAALGRRHDGDGCVAIDIDVLATHDGQCWRADAHAQAKGEFRRTPVRSLLQLGGRQVTESSGE